MPPMQADRRVEPSRGWLRCGLAGRRRQPGRRQHLGPLLEPKSDRPAEHEDNAEKNALALRKCPIPLPDCRHERARGVAGAEPTRRQPGSAAPSWLPRRLECSLLYFGFGPPNFRAGSSADDGQQPTTRASIAEMGLLYRYLMCETAFPMKAPLGTAPPLRASALMATGRADAATGFALAAAGAVCVAAGMSYRRRSRRGEGSDAELVPAKRGREGRVQPLLSCRGAGCAASAGRV